MMSLEGTRGAIARYIPQVLLCVSARRPANPTIASCVDPHQPADIRGQAGVLEVGDNNNFMINLKYFIVQVVNDVALFGLRYS